MNDIVTWRECDRLFFQGVFGSAQEMMSGRFAVRLGSRQVGIAVDDVEAARWCALGEHPPNQSRPEFNVDPLTKENDYG